MLGQRALSGSSWPPGLPSLIGGARWGRCARELLQEAATFPGGVGRMRVTHNRRRSARVGFTRLFLTQAVVRKRCAVQVGQPLSRRAPRRARSFSINLQCHRNLFRTPPAPCCRSSLKT